MRIKLENSNHDWPVNFSIEAERLRAALGPVLLQLEHIGSTSVPGLAAKPVIDIQAGVTSVQEFESSGGIATLEAAGYDYLPDYETMVPFRRLFTRNLDGIRLNNLHLVAADHPWFRRHLIFRDYLRATPSARERYESVKRELATQEWKEVNDYAGAKTAMVLALEEEAFEHFNLPEETRSWIRSSRV
jgi:GrpB-like predicted nucleotidyltransferase (UPF0157 family)